MPKYTLITGASAGFGEAIARRLSAEGHSLILVARREPRLQRLQEELKQNGNAVISIVADIRDHELLKESLSPYADKVRMLVNNAGLALGLEPAQSASISDWMTMVDTNIKGLLFVTSLVLPHMAERNDGLIVNIGSIAGTYPYPGGNVYGATKAFVQQFSKNLKADLLGTKVRVTNIEPGASETEFSMVRFKGDDEKAQKVYEGWESFTPEDVAEAVYWISSLPPRVNINSLEIMGTGQSFGPLLYAREPQQTK